MADIAKVKRNIQSMIDQNAPESDIDAYIASEGVTVEQLQATRGQAPAQPQPQAAPPQAPGYGEDIGKGFLSGIGQGAIGLGTIANDLGNLARNSIYGWAGVTPDQVQAMDAAQSQLGVGIPVGNRQATEKIEEVTGPFYQAETMPGQYAQTLGQFVPGMALGPGSTAQRVVSGTTAALGSETAGQMTKGTSVEPYARLGGALLGGIAPDAARRVVTPLPVSPERQSLIGNLADEGVDLTAGQKTGNTALRYMESELGGGKAAATMERQGEQFTKAAAGKAGITANRLTPEVMDDAFKTIGDQFDDLARRTPVPMDAQLQDDMLNVVTDYQSVSTAPARAAEDIMGRVSELAAKSGGVLDGKAYKQISSDIARYQRSASDPALKEALHGLKNALDDAVERGLSGDLLDEWRAVRNNYRNMIVLERAMTGAGEKTAEGLVSPSQLRNATVQKQGARNYIRGKGDYSKLARSGEALMKPLPNSGTAGRFNAQNLGTGITTLLGAAAGSGAGAQGALLGGLLGMGVPYAAGKALMSKPVQAYLANQLLTGKGVPFSQKAVVPLLGVTPRITGPR